MCCTQHCHSKSPIVSYDIVIDFGKVVSAPESSFGEWFEIWVSLQQIVALALKRTALCQGGVR